MQLFVVHIRTLHSQSPCPAWGEKISGHYISPKHNHQWIIIHGMKSKCSLIPQIFPCYAMMTVCMTIWLNPLFFYWPAPWQDQATQTNSMCTNSKQPHHHISTWWRRHKVSGMLEIHSIVTQVIIWDDFIAVQKWASNLIKLILCVKWWWMVNQEKHTQKKIMAYFKVLSWANVATKTLNNIWFKYRKTNFFWINLQYINLPCTLSSPDIVVTGVESVMFWSLHLILLGWMFIFSVSFKGSAVSPRGSPSPSSGSSASSCGSSSSLSDVSASSTA